MARSCTKDTGRFRSGKPIARHPVRCPTRSKRSPRQPWVVRADLDRLATRILGDPVVRPDPARPGTLAHYPKSASGSHLPARFGAPAARFGTAEHRFVATGHLFAFVRAPLADFGAEPACPGVQRRSTQHEIGTRRADLRAVEQQSDMIRRGMFTAHLQAVDGCFHTGVVTVGTVGDAFAHDGVDLVWHGVPLVTDGAWPAGDATLAR